MIIIKMLENGGVEHRMWQQNSCHKIMVGGTRESAFSLGEARGADGGGDSDASGSQGETTHDGDETETREDDDGGGGGGRLAKPVKSMV